MKLFALQFVALLAVLSAALILYDAVSVARAARKRRRRAQGGAYGVVVDRGGKVLGTYLDPFSEPTRAARVHGAGSPWTSSGPDGQSGWAWEGFGLTADDARKAANRLRRLYLMLPEMWEDEEHPPFGVSGGPPA